MVERGLLIEDPGPLFEDPGPLFEYPRALFEVVVLVSVLLILLVEEGLE